MGETIGLGAVAIVLAVCVVVGVAMRRSRRSAVRADATGPSVKGVGAAQGDVAPGGWITQAQLEAAASILQARLDPPPETVVVVNTTDAVLADALGQQPEARAAAPIDVFVVRGSFTDRGAAPTQGSPAPTGTTGVVGLGRGSTRMVAWALLGDGKKLEAMTRRGVVMALPSEPP